MGVASGKVFVTDCEGPITKNDNAAELAEAFIPKGDTFFSTLSLYDDYLAEVLCKPGYKAGDTLRLILPFFKAFGLDNRSVMKFSRRNIQIVPDAGNILQKIMEIAPAYIVSTSYSQYIMAVCDVLGFSFLNTYSTTLSLDEYDLSSTEKAVIRDFHSKILDLPPFSLEGAGELGANLSGSDRETIAVLDEIFWHLMPQLGIYRLVRDVNPIGGFEKAAAIDRIVDRHGVTIKDICYVGDSITDVQAFRKVKAGGGLAISFNGNNWAVKEAEIAITAQTAFPIGWLADLFLTRGREALEDLLVARVFSENVDAISQISSRVRKTVRSEKIGSLG
jgi:energy-converting hydrogenase A subunit R